MENQSQHRTDVEKLTVLLPYWVNHNNDHIRDQEKWLKKAEKEGLIEVADELATAIEHSKNANRHIEQANLSLKIDDGPSPLDSGQ